MQKLILDTNVIVSALISNSIPTKILYELVLTQKVETCLSNEVFEEYIAVLRREKFSKFSSFKINADIVLNKLSEISIFYETDRKITILSDLSDNKFLELAVISSADFLTTGNFLDFKIAEFENTKIVSPREYWDLYAPKIYTQF